MKSTKIFAVLSTAAIFSAMFGGCGDNNSKDDYNETPTIRVVTTQADTAEQTAKAAETTAATTKKPKKEKTTAAKSEKDETVTTKNKKKDKSDKTTASSADETVTTETEPVFQSDDGSYVEYHFRSAKLLNQHYEKHGAEFDGDFDYETAADYEKGASDVINNSEALHKTEAEDGDGVYYIEDTNEFVILSTDGYIRTYFRPNDGINYYNRQ